MKKENTTAVPNAFLNDCNLSAGEKITYILLMKYERFEKNNSGSFFTWSKDYIKRDTAKKYLSSLLAKEYIDEDNRFYYYDNGVKYDYNDQSFSTTFKTVSFFAVEEELLFAKYNGRSLTAEQKLFLIFLDRDRCDTRQGWKPHFNTYEKFGLKKVYQIKNNLEEKGLISYEVKYYGAAKQQNYINNIKISFIEEVVAENAPTETIKTIEVEAPKVEMYPILRIAIEEEKKSFGIIPLDDYQAYGRLDKKEHPEYIEMWKAYSHNEEYKEKPIVKKIEPEQDISLEDIDLEELLASI